MKLRTLLFVFPALLAGCAVGPNYRRPAVPVPDQFQGAPSNVAETSIAEVKWSELFHDDTLKQLIATALEQNFDVGMAAQRVQEARARFGIAHSERFPSVSTAAQFTASRPSLIGSTKVAPGTFSYGRRR